MMKCKVIILALLLASLTLSVEPTIAKTNLISNEIHPAEVDLAAHMPAQEVSGRVAGNQEIGNVVSNISVPVFQKGMSYVSWPPWYDSADSDESLLRLSETNTEWVAICPFWYQNNINSTKIYADLSMTPTNESVSHAINRTHDLGMKVMLKPMVDPKDGHWRGEIPPSEAWFESYAAFINFFAEFAEQHGVEMLCIGCELTSTVSNSSKWEDIISGVRARYSGPITYAATITSYYSIKWWSSVDYVGIDAYFILSSEYDPTLYTLKQTWEWDASIIEAWQSIVNKPIIFTEIGYRSGNGSNMAPWDYWTQMDVDLQEQVDCYEAAFQTLWKKSWFYGFYWWNWETNPDAGGPYDSSFTPQNKPVENLITSWYALPPRVTLSHHTLTVDTQKFDIDVLTNSTETDPAFNQSNKEISFHVTGPETTTGFCNVTIPKELLRCDDPSAWIVLLDGSPVDPAPVVTSNATHSFIYFTYTHSSHLVEILGTWAVPEFPSFPVFPLLMVIALVMAVLGKKARKKCAVLKTH